MVISLTLLPGKSSTKGRPSTLLTLALASATGKLGWTISTKGLPTKSTFAPAAL